MPVGAAFYHLTHGSDMLLTCSLLHSLSVGSGGFGSVHRFTCASGEEEAAKCVDITPSSGSSSLQGQSYTHVCTVTHKLCPGFLITPLVQPFNAPISWATPPPPQGAPQHAHTHMLATCEALRPGSQLHSHGFAFPTSAEALDEWRAARRAPADCPLFVRPTRQFIARVRGSEGKPPRILHIQEMPLVSGGTFTRTIKVELQTILTRSLHPLTHTHLV